MPAAPNASPRAQRTRAALLAAGIDLLADRPIDQFEPSTLLWGFDADGFASWQVAVGLVDVGAHFIHRDVARRRDQQPPTLQKVL